MYQYESKRIVFSFGINFQGGDFCFMNCCCSIQGVIFEYFLVVRNKTFLLLILIYTIAESLQFRNAFGLC